MGIHTIFLHYIHCKFVRPLLFTRMSSSPLVDPGKLRILFNVEELPSRSWLKGERQGLATGWFSNVAVPQLNSGTPVKVHTCTCIYYTSFRYTYTCIYNNYMNCDLHKLHVYTCTCTFAVQHVCPFRWCYAGSHVSSSPQSIPPPGRLDHTNNHDWTWDRGFPLYWFPGASPMATEEWHGKSLAVFRLSTSW